MSIIDSFEKKTANYLETIGVSLNNKKVLVALSGGADSVSLLLCLKALGEKAGFSVSALHVNHGIRGEEADRDENFCKNLCKEKSINLFVYKADVPKMAAEKKQSLESCGRDYRYSVLDDCCKENGIDYIATAHNANDNAETVLYNLIRGCGTDGLSGIPKRRDNIIRPILWAERDEIEEYLRRMGEAYVTDCTNSDNVYTRNYIRNVILPACKRINQDAVSAINRAAVYVSKDCQYLNTEAIRTDETALDELPYALQSRIIRSRYKKYCGGSLEGVHVNAVIDALGSTEQKLVSLPHGVNAVICRGKLSFAESKEALTYDAMPLTAGDNPILEGVVNVFLDADGKNGAKILKSVVKGGLYARPRKTGDKVTVRGINRSIKKCFIDKKIPPSARDIIPVICDGEGIVYVPFIGVADRAYSKFDEDFYGISVTIDERFGL